MRMIKIEPNANGSHDNQTYHGYLPQGWAIMPDNIEAEHFPFGDITVDNTEVLPTVASWSPLPLPAPAEPTPAEKRERAYETEKLVEYDGEMLTVDEANKLFAEYFAEGNADKYTGLQLVISTAKADIRERYPDA